jgi:hypothetical protein
MPYRLDESTGLIDYDQVIFFLSYFILWHQPFWISYHIYIVIHVPYKLHAFLLSALSVKRDGFLLQ